MTTKQSLKLTITKAVTNELLGRGVPNTPETVAEHLSTWWYTKSSDGLRLTPVGDLSFRLTELEYFDLDISMSHEKWNLFLIDCGKKLKCPYYFGFDRNKKLFITGQYIRLYDSKIAMMMTLYGDIQSYLDSVRVNK